MTTTSAHNARPCIIETAGLTKAFGKHFLTDGLSTARHDSGIGRLHNKLVAVNNLNLQVMRGDVFGFLGPNGSGKTTTIRMLLGLIRPTAGHINIFGLDNARHMPLILPRLGAIVETPVFYPFLSGVDNLRAIAASSGMKLGKATNNRIDEVLEIVDLRAQAKDAYRKYSLGMKQRLGIGAALLSDPELVLLDEPTNGLDPAGVYEIRQLIIRLAAMGKTIFISSHILYEIQQVCNRVAILQKGRLLKQGNVSELLQQGEQIIVRLNTPEEMHLALITLEQARQQGASWLTQIRMDSDKHNKSALFVDAPLARSAEITALLARQNLFIAEMYPRENNLEEFFLDLTTPESATDNRPGMMALAGETPEFSSRKRGM